MCTKTCIKTTVGMKHIAIPRIEKRREDRKRERRKREKREIIESVSLIDSAILLFEYRNLYINNK